MSKGHGTKVDVLDFEFNEGEGSTTRDSSSGLIGALGWSVDGKHDMVVVNDTPSGAAKYHAVQLNAGGADNQAFLVVDDRPDPVLALPTSNLTIEAWVKLMKGTKVDSSSPRPHYEGIGAYGAAYKLGLQDGKLIFTLFDIADYASEWTVPEDEWHQVAAVWRPGATVRFYADGSLRKEVSVTRYPCPFQHHYLTIGAERVAVQPLKANPLHGSICRFRIHQAALEADQLDGDPEVPKPPLDHTLVAYNFDEPAPPFQSATRGNRPAISSRSHFASTSRPTWIADTPSGQDNDSALHFKNGQVVVVNDPDRKMALHRERPAFTMQAWVKFKGNPCHRMVLFYSKGPGGEISFSVNSDRTIFVTALDILDVQSKAFIPDDGRWHHIAVVYHYGQEFRFCVDGKLEDTVPYAGPVSHNDLTQPLYIGSEWDGALQYVGSLDRLRVANRALTQRELDCTP